MLTHQPYQLLLLMMVELNGIQAFLFTKIQIIKKVSIWGADFFCEILQDSDRNFTYS